MRPVAAAVQIMNDKHKYNEILDNINTLENAIELMINLKRKTSCLSKRVRINLTFGGVNTYSLSSYIRELTHEFNSLFFIDSRNPQLEISKNKIRHLFTELNDIQFIDLYKVFIVGNSRFLKQTELSVNDSMCLFDCDFNQLRMIFINRIMLNYH